MAQPFFFPPPPPPPPRRDPPPSLSSLNSGHPGSSSAYSHNNGNRANGYQGGRTRNGFSGRRGWTGRNRGGFASSRGNYSTGAFQPSHNCTAERHESAGNATTPTLKFSNGFPLESKGEKRHYSTAFQRPPASLPRPQAAPAVPSFSASLLPPTASQSQLPPPPPVKRPRKHNQLGLTPASEDHESSSNEDEEAQLGKCTSCTTNSSSPLLSFEYKGQTSTLRTKAEIAAWIAERKRNFPTAAKAETARNKAEEERRKREDAKEERAENQRRQRLDTEKWKQEELRKRALESVASKKAKEKGKIPSARVGGSEGKEQDKARKLALKEEMLKRKLEKAQQEARKAEKALAKMRPTVPTAASVSIASDLETSELLNVTASSRANVALELEREPKAGPSELAKLKRALLADPHEEYDTRSNDGSAASQSISHTLSDEDASEVDPADELTSTSGSSLDSEDLPSNLASSSDPESSSDSAPEELTSKRTAPDHIPPPARTNSSQQVSAGLLDDNAPASRIPCRNLLRAGKCTFGEKCRYRHDIRLARGLRGFGTREEKKGRSDGSSRSGMGLGKSRKGLYQVMVDKEVEEERRAVLRVIMEMGQRGMLEEKDEQQQQEGEIEAE